MGGGRGGGEEGRRKKRRGCIEDEGVVTEFQGEKSGENVSVYEKRGGVGKREEEEREQKEKTRRRRQEMETSA